VSVTLVDTVFEAEVECEFSLNSDARLGGTPRRVLPAKTPLRWLCSLSPSGMICTPPSSSFRPWWRRMAGLFRLSDCSSIQGSHAINLVMVRGDLCNIPSFAGLSWKYSPVSTEAKSLETLSRDASFVPTCCAVLLKLIIPGLNNGTSFA
jgi:hypothetical protein